MQIKPKYLVLSALIAVGMTVLGNYLVTEYIEWDLEWYWLVGFALLMFGECIREADRLQANEDR